MESLLTLFNIIEMPYKKFYFIMLEIGKYTYALTGDIKKIYRMIRMESLRHPKYSNY